jgi:hypothetical protein
VVRVPRMATLLTSPWRWKARLNGPMKATGPRPAASRAIPQPLIPPPTTAMSKGAVPLPVSNERAPPCRWPFRHAKALPSSRTKGTYNEHNPMSKRKKRTLQRRFGSALRRVAYFRLCRSARLYDSHLARAKHFGNRGRWQPIRNEHVYLR